MATPIVNVRIPTPLREKLEVEAYDNHRTLSAEIRDRLWRSLKKRRAPKGRRLVALSEKENGPLTSLPTARQLRGRKKSYAAA
jgi:hypothetical protein